MMYGAKTWAVKKVREKKLDVAEMRLLRLIDCLFGKHKQYASHGRYTWQNKLWQYNIDHSK